MLWFLQRHLIRGCDSGLRVECLCCQRAAEEPQHISLHRLHPLAAKTAEGKTPSGQTVFPFPLAQSAVALLATSYER